MSNEERELLERIDARLAALEQKVEMLVLPPRAVKPRVAGSLLGCSEKIIKSMIGRGELRTVPVGERQHVPMSEIVRLTTVTAPPARGPVLLPRARSAKVSPTELEKMRALARRRD